MTLRSLSRLINPIRYQFQPVLYSASSSSSSPQNIQVVSRSLHRSTFNLNPPPVSPTPNASGESKEQQQNDGNNGGSELEKKLKEDLDRIVAENNTLQEKAKDLEDKYLRALAETENVRTRLTKQIQDAKLFAVQGFCKDMTEIEEILRMAVDSVPKEEIKADNKHLKNLYEGLQMTSANLLQVFKKHGLTTINPLNTKFNPNEHEAVVMQEVEGKESGTVVFVSKLGYKLHDRVIRPAIVGVAK